LEVMGREVLEKVVERRLGMGTGGARKCMDDGNEELVRMRKREMGEGKVRGASEASRGEGGNELLNSAATN